MLVVISDLHFEEEARDRAGEPGAAGAVELVRNVSPEAFHKFRDFLVDRATPGQPLDLVLAGDIFDLHRTAMWFDDASRPYDDPAAFRPGSAHEAKVLAIVAAIAAEARVKESLAVLASLPQAIPGARVHYVPGNHDRLVNATPATRDAVRDLLGMPRSPEPLPHCLVAVDPPVLVRHGHEYDRYNFSVDWKGAIPLDLPGDAYAGAAFGDFVTLEIAARLPAQFRALWGQRMLTDPDLRSIYIRLLQFDDVRPQSALVDFLLHIPGTSLDEGHLWSRLEPVVRQILDDLCDHPFLAAWLERFDAASRPDLVDLVQLLLATRPWRLGLPLSVVRTVATKIRDAGGADTLVATVQREEALASGAVRAVIAGHTHEPQVALLDARGGTERYYIDTGTWRTRVPAAPGGRGFGQLKALTYVVAWGAGEDRGRDAPAAGGPNLWSFDYWSGYTQRWWK